MCGKVRDAPASEDHLDIGKLVGMGIEITGVDHMRVELGERSNLLAPTLTEDIAVGWRIVIKERRFLFKHRSSLRGHPQIRRARSLAASAVVFIAPLRAKPLLIQGCDGIAF